MHADELWQLYNDNGTPIVGKGATKDEFNSNHDLIMANVHIWFWRSNGQTTEIMLQRRALDEPNRPGWFHISAGGHINVGETPVEAAVREVYEEMGIKINPAKLHFAHSVRIIPRDPRDIVHVFLYKLNGDEEFTYADGEVDSYEWRTLNEWKRIIQDAENNNLVPQGQLYFDTLTKALEHIAEKEHLKN